MLDLEVAEAIGVPPWESAPYQLVSWWEMEKFSAETFFKMSEVMEKIRAEWGIEGRESESIKSKTISFDLALLDLMIDSCKSISLSVSQAHLIELKKAIEEEPCYLNRGDAAAKLNFIRDTIIIEMRANVFMYIPPDRAEFYNKAELFDKDVGSKFTSIKFDIVEAGNCLAVGRGTACVFHLMRIMEVGVQRFGDKLGVPLAQETVWQVILDQANKKIKALPPKDEFTIDMAEVSAILYSVKLAWRNEVMHPKETYTLEEAENIFRQVKIFMQKLAMVV